MRILLALHALLLLLASTGFTMLTAALGQASLQWCYFRYASSNGWGVKFVSDYSALEIVTYLLAFSIGIVAFYFAFNRGHPATGGLGLLLSLVGLISFVIEGSHWIFDHHMSWLAFSPAVMLMLAFWACLPKRLADDGIAQLRTQLDGNSEPT